MKEGNNFIGASFGLTINLGNYESAKIDFWRQKVIESDTNLEVEYNELWSDLVKEVSKRLEEIRKKLKSDGNS